MAKMPQAKRKASMAMSRFGKGYCAVVAWGYIIIIISSFKSLLGLCDYCWREYFSNSGSMHCGGGANRKVTWLSIILATMKHWIVGELVSCRLKMFGNASTVLRLT